MSDKNGVLLERFRKCVDKGFTREEIASAIGCDTSMVTKHYNGIRTITIDYAVKYADFFKVSVDYLVGLADAEITLSNDEGKKISEICKYTGLSQEAVENLHNCISKNCNFNYLPKSEQHVLSMINNLLSDNMFSDTVRVSSDFETYILAFNGYIGGLENATKYSYDVERLSTDYENYYFPSFTFFANKIRNAFNYRDLADLSLFKSSRAFEDIVKKSVSGFEAREKELNEKQEEYMRIFLKTAVDSNYTEIFEKYLPYEFEKVLNAEGKGRSENGND